AAQQYSVWRPGPARTVKSARQADGWCAATTAAGRGYCSSGFVQAEGVSVHCVDRPLVFDLTVDDDSAADGVSITLRHYVADDRRLGCRDRVRPRQDRVVNSLRLRIHIQVVDGCDGPRCTKDLKDHLLWVKRNDLLRDATGGRRLTVRAEDAVQPI